ncbi:MAG: hypothetical protein ACLFP1_04710 [Candidatus Goldiibacteriota bacterium]
MPGISSGGAQYDINRRLSRIFRQKRPMKKEEVCFDVLMNVLGVVIHFTIQQKKQTESLIYAAADIF